MTSILDSGDPALYEVVTRGPGPAGRLPLSDELLRHRPSGDAFGMSQDAGMGWDPQSLTGPQYVLLSTLGGLRADDGTPVALGYHTGHWEVGLAVKAAAEAIQTAGGVPYAAHCSDPCDGRTQGTTGMLDSLAYRNDAAAVFCRLARSIPAARGVLGVATCDKGLPAMMMALAGLKKLPCVLVPGGVMLPPADTREDTATIQSIGVRYAHHEISLDAAADAGCRVCASGGGGCHFLGTAATAQVVGEALGLSLPHSALAPSGQPIWLDMARRSALALMELDRRGMTVGDVLSAGSIRNAMVLFAAFGGSTNLVLHLAAVAHSAGLQRPSLDDWIEVSRRVPRLVSVLPNGPVQHPTVNVYLAGGVPEVMLQLQGIGLLDLGAMTVAGTTLGEVLRWWESSPRRAAMRRRLGQSEGIDPDGVILSPQRAREAGLASTVCFPRGNLAPGGSITKNTAIDARLLDAHGVYRRTGPAKVFTREKDAIAAFKGQGPRPIRPGDVLVLMGRGPLGAGMEEVFQLTAALKYLSWGHEVAVITDARFSGVSTGPCVGWVTPEALADGPLGRLCDGDRVQIVIDTRRLGGSIDLVGDAVEDYTPEQAARVLAERPAHPELTADENLPPETRLWAALQAVSGGPWGGCVFDVDRIVELISARPSDRPRRPRPPSAGP
jgi:putative YjhG/YagF family dehydratase